MAEPLKIIIATCLCVVCPMLGLQLGLQLFVFMLITVSALFLLILFSVAFLDPLTLMVQAWVSPVVSTPLIIGGLAIIIIGIAMKLSFSVESATSNMSEAGNKAMGCGIGVGLGILGSWLMFV